jgi:predicted NBD/HSP70 family sugar kinase
MTLPARAGTRADQTSVRRANLGVVVDYVARGGPCTRARIAADTGLTRGTVSSLVGELIELGLLRETGEVAPPGGVGRPGTALDLTDLVGALALELNVDYLSAAVEDLSGTVRRERRVYRENRGAAPGPLLDELAALAHEALDEAERAGVLVAGAALAVAGLVEAATGTVLRAPNLGWRGVPVASELSERLGGLPVRVENEANLAALAEHARGAARGIRNFICVFGEVGVGAGIFLGGELFRGSHGFGGEIGHMTVDPGGEPCACGSRGCLETVVGQEAIARRAGIRTAEGGRTRSLTAEIVRRAVAGDERTLAALHEAGTMLGTALGSAINLFDLDAVVLGGCFGPLAPWLVDDVGEALRDHLLLADLSPCEVRTSTFGEDAALRGAAALTLREVLAAPRTVSDRRKQAAEAVA